MKTSQVSILGGDFGNTAQSHLQGAMLKGSLALQVADCTNAVLIRHYLQFEKVTFSDLVLKFWGLTLSEAR